MNQNISAIAAKEKLIEGNRIYLKSKQNPGDISPEIREKTCKEGQHPYAIILCCSDSREIPEAIFSAGIGELFVIRVAGNVVDSHQLGSIEYAADHLAANWLLFWGMTIAGPWRQPSIMIRTGISGSLRTRCLKQLEVKRMNIKLPV